MKVLIIGGGAAGTACAIRLKQNNPQCDVTILEHLGELCKKIYATGNGRCNLTNNKAEHYDITKDFFESLGVMLRTDHAGRVYPYSNQAGTVAETLKRECGRLGVNVVTSCNAERAEKSGYIYNVYTDKGIFSADTVVLATGGMSQSSLGSDGSGYKLAMDLGLKISKLSPALVQLKSSNKNCRALKGVRAKCKIFAEINGDIVGEEYGEVLFTDYGLSGIATMILAKYIDDDRIKKGLDRACTIIDFVPDCSEAQLTEHYKQFGGFDGILPSRLCSIVMRQAGGDAEKAAKYIKHQRFIITGTKGFDFAQITKGGVTSEQLLPSGETRLHNKLYIVGELTDKQFDCGGFNLDYAFSSGIIAADSIKEKYDKN